MDASPVLFSYVPTTAWDANRNLETPCKIDFEQWIMKDSKHVTDAHIRELHKKVAKSKHDLIVITHGTDTMPENARKLMQLLGETNKRVIFTGAMRPIANSRREDGLTREVSDGVEHIHYIVKNIDSFPAGVSVLMHNQVFSPLGLRKNFETSTFYTDHQCMQNGKIL